MICLSLQLSEVNFFRHQNLGQWKVVFSGIIKDMRGVEYTL
jgi:hypothetical protein